MDNVKVKNDESTDDENSEDQQGKMMKDKMTTSTIRLIRSSSLRLGNG